jgi:hypothetical protein
MATKFVYVQGDATKTPVDPTKQPEGTILVRVTGTDREVCFTAQGTGVPPAAAPLPLAPVKEPVPPPHE